MAMGGNRRPEQSTRLRLECLMCSEGEVKCSGYDNQVAREGRGMCVAKEAAGNETSDGQAAASVSDMGEQQVEEVDSEGRPSL